MVYHVDIVVGMSMILISLMHRTSSFQMQPASADGFISPGFHRSSAPEGLHQSPGSDPYTERVIMWTCATEECLSNMTVKSFQHWWTVQPTTRRLSMSSQLKWVQRVALKDLLKSDEYQYTVADHSFTFYTWSNARSLEFLLYGSIEDSMGDQSPAHRQLMYELSMGKYAAVINLGSLTCQKQSIHQFLSNLQSLASQVPYLTTPGKGELDDKFNLYTQLFSMPNVDWPMRQLWYSFNVRYAHIISFSTEVYFTKNLTLVQEQLRWLEEDLIEANSQKNRQLRKYPWIIAFSHRALYCSGDQECIHFSMRFKDLENLFHRYGVDLVITTQDNFYERTFPVFLGNAIYGSYVHPTAPIYVNTAAFTCNTHHIRNMPYVHKPKQAPEWCAKKIYTHMKSTYGRFRIHNATHLRWQEMSAEDHTSIDAFWLVQYYHGPFNIPRGNHPIIVGVFVTFAVVLLVVGVGFVGRRRIRDCLEKKRALKHVSYISLQERSTAEMTTVT